MEVWGAWGGGQIRLQTLQGSVSRHSQWAWAVVRYLRSDQNLDWTVPHRYVFGSVCECPAAERACACAKGVYSRHSLFLAHLFDSRTLER